MQETISISAHSLYPVCLEIYIGGFRKFVPTGCQALYCLGKAGVLHRRTRCLTLNKELGTEFVSSNRSADGPASEGYNEPKSAPLERTVVLLLQLRVRSSQSVQVKVVSMNVMIQRHRLK